MTVPEIRQTVIFNAPIDKVWKTVSTSEGISAWFMPNDFEPVLGHAFTIQSPFGPSPCKVIELEEPERLSFSWDTDGWVVTFLLKEIGDQTEFTLIHAGWKSDDELIEKAQEKPSIVRERMNGGWAMIVGEKLRKAVEA